MTEPNTLLVAGDLHGDPQHTVYVFERAFAADADAIVQVGDFGYWEHARGGDAFLDLCSTLAVENELPLYWIDGNHENHTMLRALYGPGGRLHNPTPEGFWEIRQGVYYIPRGTRWVWNGVHMMGLGGAYSIDKFYRLDRENNARRDHAEANMHRQAAGAAARPFDPDKYQLWWPEEEITDEELAKALEDPTPIDILFTHDKPRASNPKWNRKAFDECLPNQDKIQTVVRTLKPKLLVHGHLHYRYTDYIYNGLPGGHTRVEGLDCNLDAQPQPSKDSAEHSWLLVELKPAASDSNGVPDAA